MYWHINKSIIDYSNSFIYMPLHLRKVVVHKKNFKYMSLALYRVIPGYTLHIFIFKISHIIANYKQNYRLQ